ncbi:MAG: ABC transporter permease [Alphaproteobacteria bacterium]|nr:ABC transporter permease [Alphaproteobacteria bacterium]
MAHWRRWAPIIVLAGLCLFIGAKNANFFSLFNLINMLNVAAIPLVICMGATFIILMGSIDLSVEGTIALCAVAASMLVANDFTGMAIGLWSVPLAILLGGALGLVSGVVHVKLKIPSFMATLGIGFAGIGVATAILGGVMVRVSDNDFRSYLSLGRVFNIPAAVWIAAATVAIAWIIQDRTRIGRWLYAIGTDEATARNAGIPVERTRILIFGVAGLFYGLAGALSAAQIGRGHALISQDRLFTAITAVVVGGTALSGGVGSVLNTVVGVFIVIVLNNGMVLMGIEPYVQKGVQGLLIIAAVAVALDRSRLDVVK